MDTFIDKLAQKLTAQEMIKANSAADAAELQKTRMMVAQYEELLKEIRQVNSRNTEAAGKLEQLVADSLSRLENTEQVSRLTEASIKKIEEIQAGNQNLEQLEVKLAELKDQMTPLFEELTDHVHKENVKVYRNVQAVVVEENAKINETLAAGLKSISGRMTAVLGVSAAALLAAAAGLVFQMLSYFKVI